METFGQYLRRNMDAKGIAKQSELEVVLETFARHRFGFPLR